MTIGELITEARQRRRKELDAELQALMVGREPCDHDELMRWAKEVDRVRAEIKLLDIT